MIHETLSNEEREAFARMQRGILALELRGRKREADRIRRNLIARAKRRLVTGQSAWLWMCLGDAYVQASAARSAYLRALSIDSNHAESVYALGDLEWRSGNYARAEELVDRLMKLKIDPELQSLAFELARSVYKRQGRKDSYRRATSKYVAAARRCRKAGPKLGESMPELFESDARIICECKIATNRSP
ncbi:MAG: tetratricopeptide repeat protein [Phycisphaerales bacterium]|nr:tetratricopeptide repeat protein [Phycisphaerales bacterium]